MKKILLVLVLALGLVACSEDTVKIQFEVPARNAYVNSQIDYITYIDKYKAVIENNFKVNNFYEIKHAYERIAFLVAIEFPESDKYIVEIPKSQLDQFKAVLGTNKHLKILDK